MTNYTFNSKESRKADKSEINKKKEKLLNFIIKRDQGRINRLKKGLEKIEKYAEQVKDWAINSAIAEYGYQKDMIEKDFSIKEHDIKEAAKKIDEILSNFGSGEEEKRIIQEAMEKTNYINELALKQKEVEKQRRLQKLEDDFNKSLEEAEEKYNSFISKYRTIFRQRIENLERDLQTKLNIIKSADEITINMMYNNLYQKDSINTNKINEYKDWIILSVLVGGLSIAIYNDYSDKKNIIDQQKKEANVTISVPRMNTYEQLISSGPIISPNEGINSKLQELNNNIIEISTTSLKNVKINKSTSKKEISKSKTKENKSKMGQKVINLNKNNMNSKLEKMISILENDRDKLIYDGFPLLRRTTNGMLKSVLKEVKAKIEAGNLTEQQKKELLRFFRLVKKYIDNENKYITYEDLREAINTIKDGKYSVKSLTEANESLTHSLKWKGII